MNKQLAKKGTTLNKNMTNTEKLNLTDLTVTDITVTETISVDEVTAHFINAESISTPELVAECSELTLPTSPPTGNIAVGTIYYIVDPTHGSLLNIYNGTKFDQIQLL